MPIESQPSSRDWPPPDQALVRSTPGTAPGRLAATMGLADWAKDSRPLPRLGDGLSYNGYTETADRVIERSTYAMAESPPDCRPIHRNRGIGTNVRHGGVADSSENFPYLFRAAVKRPLVPPQGLGAPLPSARRAGPRRYANLRQAARSPAPSNSATPAILRALKPAQLTSTVVPFWEPLR
jgi:hypothetical protein